LISSALLAVVDYKTFGARKLLAQGVEHVLPSLVVGVMQGGGLTQKQSDGFQTNCNRFGDNDKAVDLAFKNKDVHLTGDRTLDENGRFTAFKLKDRMDNARLSGWEIFPEAYKESSDYYRDFHLKGFELWVKSRQNDVFNPMPLGEPDQTRLNCLIVNALSRRDPNQLSDFEKTVLQQARDALLGDLQSRDKEEMAQKWMALATRMSSKEDRRLLEEAVSVALGSKVKESEKSRVPVSDLDRTLWYLLAGVQPSGKSREEVDEILRIRNINDPSVRLNNQVQFIKGSAPKKLNDNVTPPPSNKPPEFGKGNTPGPPPGDTNQPPPPAGNPKFSWFLDCCCLSLVGALTVGGILAYRRLTQESRADAADFRHTVTRPGETRARMASEIEFKRALETKPGNARSPAEARENFRKVADWLKDRLDTMNEGTAKDVAKVLEEHFRDIADGKPGADLPKESPGQILRRAGADISPWIATRLARKLGAGSEFLEVEPVKQVRNKVLDPMKAEVATKSHRGTEMSTQLDSMAPADLKRVTKDSADWLDTKVGEVTDPTAKDFLRKKAQELRDISADPFTVPSGKSIMDILVEGHAKLKRATAPKGWFRVRGTLLLALGLPGGEVPPLSPPPAHTAPAPDLKADVAPKEHSGTRRRATGHDVSKELAENAKEVAKGNVDLPQEGPAKDSRPGTAAPAPEIEMPEEKLRELREQLTKGTVG
jgi:hypothetical protein